MRSLIRTAFTLALFSVSAAKLHSNFEWNAIKYVYAFGDSYTFVEGAAGRVNYSFIGDELNFSFTPEELVANTINPNRTSSEGAGWLEFLTGCFGGSPFDCGVQLWDFAFAGADISGDILPLHHDYTVSLVRQVEQWITYASRVIPHPSKETLTFWWMGINDTGDVVNNATIPDFDAFWETEMNVYFEAVQSTVKQGLKQHVFINVPPGHRSPNSNTNATKAAIQEKRIDGYNAALSKHAELFSNRNPSATVITFDANAFFNKLLDAPQEYGFDNIFTACLACNDTTGYFWYDNGHPTGRVHQLLAGAIAGKLASC